MPCIYIKCMKTAGSKWRYKDLYFLTTVILEGAQYCKLFQKTHIDFVTEKLVCMLKTDV
jgi:hypothetical protein